MNELLIYWSENTTPTFIKFFYNVSFTEKEIDLIFSHIRPRQLPFTFYASILSKKNPKILKYIKLKYPEYWDVARYYSY